MPLGQDYSRRDPVHNIYGNLSVHRAEKEEQARRDAPQPKAKSSGIVELPPIVVR